MNTDEILDFLISLQSLWNHPLTLITKEGTHVIPNEAPDLTKPFQKQIFQCQRPSVLTLDYGIMLGVLPIDKKEEVFLTAGPVMTMDIHPENAEIKIRHVLGLSPVDQNKISWCSRETYKTLIDIMALLSTHFLHFSRKVSLDLLLKSSPKEQEAFRKALVFSEEGPVSANYQIDYTLEKKILNTVKNGDLSGLHKTVGGLFQLNMRPINKTPLYQLKAMCICVVTLVTRAAIDGGMGYQDAFNLSDSYIAIIETIPDEAGVLNLMMEIAEEFTRRVNDIAVATHRNTENYTRWIRDHIYEPITVKSMADRLYISVSQLDRLFARDLGQSPAQIIRQYRLEESCQLLRYSSHSIEEISELLCFSSSSHFIRSFSRQYNMTPGQYRQQMEET